uniref:Uncharacterized protein n=1 Tax=Anguilla anguilla TaxID=7936 RepID=A0A0E9TH26_ANGAN
MLIMLDIQLPFISHLVFVNY